MKQYIQPEIIESNINLEVMMVDGSIGDGTTDTQLGKDRTGGDDDYTDEELYKILLNWDD